MRLGGALGLEVSSLAVACSMPCEAMLLSMALWMSMRSETYGVMIETTTAKTLSLGT